MGRQKGNGRPSSYSDDMAAAICEAIAQGQSVRSICAKEGMPPMGTVFRWLADENNASFREQYARAREAQADVLFDEMVDIADDSVNDFVERRDGSEAVNGDAIARAKLRIDTRKWVMGKMAPKKYGEVSRLDVGLSGGLTLTHEQMLDKLA